MFTPYYMAQNTDKRNTVWIRTKTCWRKVESQFKCVILLVDREHFS